MPKIRTLLLVIIFLLALFLPHQVRAEDFKSDYTVEYFLSDTAVLKPNVKFTIKITNLRSDTYVRKFALLFPKSFEINDVAASDDKGTITPQITKDNDKTKIELEFIHPTTGKGSINTFYLQFSQNNLFSVKGNIWEIVIPTIQNTSNQAYSIVVNLPQNTGKKLAIAKPKPDRITGNKIFWNNPQLKTIYAVFGEEQYYKVKLDYGLENTKFIPVYTDIAFPPDMLYQKVYINSITPQPALTYLDDDGNFMGRYYLKPKENRKVVFDGVVKTLVYPRKELQPYINAQINQQKSYLLQDNNFWQLKNPQKYSEFKTPEAIYRHVATSLTYDYARVSKNIDRLGAQYILDNTTQAVCTEFSDSFVAISRAQGIYAREIEGYGFSDNEKLRPLSLVADVLHSWPEYFDQASSLWKPVDPTWENTSGIDYFSSFDLNHVAFVIHGKDSDRPLSAGMYKLGDTKDVTVTPVKSIPADAIKLTLMKNTSPSQINDKQQYGITYKVKNESNVALWNIPVVLKTQNIEATSAQNTILSFAPYEEKEIAVTMRANKTLVKNGSVSLYVSGLLLATNNLTITPYIVEISIKAIFIVLMIAIPLSLLLFLRRRLSKRADTPL